MQVKLYPIAKNWGDIENHKISELCEFLNYDSSRGLLKILDDQQAQELRRIWMKSFPIIYTEL